MIPYFQETNIEKQRVGQRIKFVKSNSTRDNYDMLNNAQK